MYLYSTEYLFFKASLPMGSNGKKPACNAGDLGLIPGSGRFLEKGMATSSSILPWRIPRTEEAGGLHPWGHKESDMTEWLTLSLFTHVQT